MAGADPWQTPKLAADPAPKTAKTESSAVTTEADTTNVVMALDAPWGNAIATGLVQLPEPLGLRPLRPPRRHLRLCPRLQQQWPRHQWQTCQ